MYVRYILYTALAVGVLTQSIWVPNRALAQTAITSDTTVTTTNTSGLAVADGVGSVTITFDPSGGAITVGADATAALTSNETDNAVTLVAGDDGGTAGNITKFSGDVVAAGGGNITITIGETGVDNNATLEIQGNVTETSGAITITVGDGSAESTNNDAILNIDSANDENLTIAAAIDGDGTGNDTATLAITPTVRTVLPQIALRSATTSAQLTGLTQSRLVPQRKPAVLCSRERLRRPTSA
jgi:hypothetical protein